MKWKAAVLTFSDKGFCGERIDESGPAICRMIEQEGYSVEVTKILPDEKEDIKKCLCKLCDEQKVDVIFTTGGTGFSERDCAPEATMEIGHKNVPGIAEIMRAESMKITKRAMLSRGVSVIRGKTLIVNLPGSPKAAVENLEAVLEVLDHGLGILTGRDSECGRKADSK